MKEVVTLVGGGDTIDPRREFSEYEIGGEIRV